MAVANIPPHEAAKIQREQNLLGRLNSIDPVTRYRAKEELDSINMAEMGRIASAQAKRTEAEYFGELKRCEEIDRQTMAKKYKPLPAWAKSHIVKND